MAQAISPYPDRRLFLTTVCLLAGAPLARIGDVQALEIFLLLHLSYLFASFVLAGFRCRLFGVWKTLGIPHALFLLTALLLALASLRFKFYPPPEVTVLKLPLILSVARVTEISLGAFYMVYIASILGREPANRAYAMKAYFWAGVTSAAYSLLSFPVLFATNLQLGAYLPSYRARGGFNEGGPYGLYLVSVVVVGLLLYDLRKLRRAPLMLSATLVFAALLASQSKAAFLALCILFLVNLAVLGSLRQKIVLGVVALSFVSAIWTLTSVPESLAGYLNGYQLIQKYGSDVNEELYGGFGGRVAGAILVPRMIQAHPITGIGLGNFSLLRNAPEYLQGLPTKDTWELPGIGLVSYVAELGIPLFVYLMILLCVPAWMSRGRVSKFAFVLAAYQPLAHVFGVQLNFYYPWICAAFALAVPALQDGSLREHPIKPE
jgi:hypothetical protein